ncbi:helix-turn-helix transcriptional regulator [Clostridium perfringens]|uniref:helix-turn-helix domain-containing protein n=1 Tax=Clostridium perfringens TaxID=1502 RepID=UPI0018D7414D|nr:helix-turn-helix transcriptional regulator [Clostridium perfringens]MCR1963973.1 helix-turn-helix transcriptional regulator [Clostridium perfringens]QPR51392.1 helix-turn-helix transcriptional regulator [Clostridium perfringens]
MIGIQYLCEIFGISYADLARRLGISRQTIAAWTSGRRKVSEKHYEKLKEIFKGIPEEYFQKELTELDKLQIQRIKLENNIVGYTYKDTIWDEETKQEIEVDRVGYNIPVETIEMLDLDIRHKELFKNIDDLIARRTEGAEDEWDYIGKKSEVLEVFELLYEIMNKEYVPYRRVKNILDSIKVAKEKRMESDLFVRKLAAIIREQMMKDKKIEEENIKAAKELLEIEDLL